MRLLTPLLRRKEINNLVHNCYEEESSETRLMVVRIQHQGHILTGTSIVTTVNSGDTGIGYDGGSNQAARTKANSVDWDDWSE